MDKYPQSGPRRDENEPTQQELVACYAQLDVILETWEGGEFDPGTGVYKTILGENGLTITRNQYSIGMRLTNIFTDNFKEYSLGTFINEENRAEVSGEAKTERMSYFRPLNLTDIGEINDIIVALQQTRE